MDQHLTDARVTKNRDLVPVGAWSFPKDRGEFFPRVDHDCFVLTILPDSAIALSPATAERDVQTGYLKPTLSGGRLILPSELSRMILGFLENNLEETTISVRQAQQGPHALISAKAAHPYVPTDRSDQRRSTYYAQPLTDWQLDLRPTECGVEVEISAALLADCKLKPWAATFSQEPDDGKSYWPLDGGVIPRIDIKFLIDDVTRAVVFWRVLSTCVREARPDSVPKFEGDSTGSRLDKIIAGYVGQIYGRSSLGEFASVVHLQKGGVELSFSRHADVQPNGFVATRPEFPAISLINLDFRRRISGLTTDRALQVESSSGEFGHLRQHWQYQGPSQTITKTIYKFCAVREGLRVELALFVTNLTEVPGGSFEDGWIKKDFTIPSESLAARDTSWRLLWQMNAGRAAAVEIPDT